MIQYKWLFILIRLSFLIVFIIFWPKIIAKDNSEIIYYQKIQWRIALWLILFELLINSNIVLLMMHA